MKKLLLVLLSIIVHHGANAQNWRTVCSVDTAFFRAGRHASTPQSGGASSTDSGIIRGISIRGMQVSGADTVFLLQRGWRDTSGSGGLEWSNCIDSTAPSWLGPFFIRKSDGTEYFFNSRMDTITIMTLATIGESWMIARDTSGIWFKGTVVQSGLMTVDGQIDSFKTISIQAFNAANPVPHWYNTMVFQLTKDHGWTRTLDLYRFAHRKREWDYGGTGIDSTQHSRLPAAIGKVDLAQPDIAWKYAPGNEWIRDEISGVAPLHSNNQRFITYDSIISNVPLSPGYVAVKMKTIQYLHYLNATGKLEDATVSTIHTDTIATGLAYHAYLPILSFNGVYESINLRLFSDSLCGDHHFVRMRKLRRSAYTGLLNGCIRVGPGVSGFTLLKLDYLKGFGCTYSYYFDGEFMFGHYSELDYPYLQLNGCRQGTKIDVAKLAVLPLSKAEGFRLYPNPANNVVSISTSLPSQSWKLALRNVSGQIILQQEIFGQQLNISTTDIPSGLYFLEVAGRENCQTFKVIIQH